jgi:hypothetical protein
VVAKAELLNANGNEVATCDVSLINGNGDIELSSLICYPSHISRSRFHR